ncbi:hypothetical protein VP01_1196g1 [Puccinia sorghi]|uniref:Uncharacterized protein n=1 Tax=Puccinia sorghi TaxID=27349 RepID=A0A0L6VQQ9_9BASI|nr:hypothetical protein VP01_1196g1 [Puccinia sorghi]
MSNNWTLFSQTANQGKREDDEITAVISPSKVFFQRTYEALCVSSFPTLPLSRTIIGLVFTSILLISHTFGRRKHKRHPVVIAFVATAILNYLNALLPWLFHFLTTNSSSLSQIPGGNNFLCNTIVLLISLAGSTGYWQAIVSILTYLIFEMQTVIPSFAATFVGEALRITWQVSKMTHSSSTAAFADYSLTTRHSLVSSNPKAPPTHQIKSPPDDFEISNVLMTLPKVEHVVHINPTSMSHEETLREMLEKPGFPSLSGNPSCSKGMISRMSDGREEKWPFVLCLLPTLCGLPQLFLTLISYIRTGKAWISIDIVSCRVQSEAAASLGVITLLFVLALTALFSGLMLSFSLGIRRSASQHGRSNLDMSMLIPIGFLSAQSIAGCLIVAVMYFTSKHTYHMALDLFGVINPICSAFILTDWEVFTIWNRWIRRWLSFVMTPLGFTNLNPHTGPSATIPNHPANKSCLYCHEGVCGVWVPPKPSYNRTHRLVSMSSIGDVDIEEEDDNLQTRFSGQATLTRPSRFRSLRKLTLRGRSGASRRSTTAPSRRRGVTISKRSSNQPRHSAPPEKTRKFFCPMDPTKRAEFLPGHQSHIGGSESL